MVHFYTLIPLYGEELDYKIKHSEEELLHKLNKIGVTDVLILPVKIVVRSYGDFFKHKKNG